MSDNDAFAEGGKLILHEDGSIALNPDHEQANPYPLSTFDPEDHEGAHGIIDFWPDPVGGVGEAFYLDTHKYSLIMGPFGSAKTKTCAMRGLDFIMDMPVDNNGVRRSRGLVYRNYEADLLTTTIPDWLSIFPGDHEEYGTMIFSSPIKHYLDFIGDDGIPVVAEVHFLPLNNVDEAKKKLKGQEYTWEWCNEASEQTWLVCQTALGRMGGRYPPVADMPDIDFDGRGNRYPSMAIFDSNSCDDEHWMYQLLEEPTASQKKIWGRFKQPGGVILNEAGQWVTNPKAENLNNLGKTYYQDQIDMASRDAKTASWIKINLGNQYGSVIKGQPCWWNYNPLVHERDDFDYDPSLPVYMGLDFGRTPAAAFFQEVDGGYRFFAEFTSTDMSAELYAPECSAWLLKEFGILAGDVVGYCDPAGKQGGQAKEISAKKEMIAQGFTQLMSAPGIEDNNMFVRRKAMIEPLQRMLVSGMPAIMIHSRCKSLRRGAAAKFYIKEMSSADDELYRSEPVKNFWSHICEAAEYGMVGRGEGQAYAKDGPKKSQRRPTSKPNTRHLR